MWARRRYIARYMRCPEQIPVFFFFSCRMSLSASQVQIKCEREVAKDSAWVVESRNKSDSVKNKLVAEAGGLCEPYRAGNDVGDFI